MLAASGGDKRGCLCNVGGSGGGDSDGGWYILNGVDGGGSG